MLSTRESTILQILVTRYIATALPVSSENIAIGEKLGVSSATIRNTMAHLEEEGYIIRAHVSAGATPTDKGYRYYVENFSDEDLLPKHEQHAMRQVFCYVGRGLEEWAYLATTVLSRRLRHVSLVMVPHTRQCHFKHIQLVSVQELTVLLVLVLKEMKLRRELMSLSSPASQDELDEVSNKLNVVYEGCTSSRIDSADGDLDSVEHEVVRNIKRMMEEEDQQRNQEFYLDGMRHLVGHPELGSNRVAQLVEMLEDRALVGRVLSHLVKEPGLKVSIGSENREEALRQCSVITRRFGVPGGMEGAIGVIGPTRMPYMQVIPTVNCLSSVMTESMMELYA
ncbi:MAG: heat-inducible transcriptional repressor HrcA [Chloroflexota bacterium]|nr:heat-inducible transcriptional repressor HrcA [Chloroflexota bacterium]